MRTSSRGPDVRLALSGHSRGEAGAEARIVGALAAPTVRLAHVIGAQGDNNLIGRRGVEQLPDSSAPALLISYVYLKPFFELRAQVKYRDWALDSGAFSAKNSGIEIKLDEYIETAKRLLAEDPTLAEVFALDVIGDWRASVANAEKMWAAGIEAIPTFHGGSPWEVLVGLARDYPKVAIGGVALQRASFKEKFAGECFARVWPHKLHGFGYGAGRYLKRFPFHSIDATNWEVGACKFGNWKSFGKMSIRGSRQNLRAEVEHFLRMERDARSRWAKEMAGLAPTVRLAVDPGAASGSRLRASLRGEKE